MFTDFEKLEGELLLQAKTKEAKNLLKSVIDKCRREKKTPKETFSEINQLIINPFSMGVC